MEHSGDVRASVNIYKIYRVYEEFFLAHLGNGASFRRQFTAQYRSLLLDQSEDSLQLCDYAYVLLILWGQHDWLKLRIHRLEQDLCAMPQPFRRSLLLARVDLQRVGPTGGRVVDGGVPN